MRGWKNALLALIPVAFFVALELALAALGVERLVDREDPFRGFSGLVSVFERDGDVYRTRRSAADGTFNDQSFRAGKPDGGLRIFALGGSSAFGFPWDASVSFTGVLGDVLQAAHPRRPIEVINVAGISYAMHRLNLVADELLDYEPDVFVVYSGHNEFIEPGFFEQLKRRSAARNRLEYALAHSRLYSALRAGARRLSGPAETARPSTAAEYEVLVERDRTRVYDGDRKREIVEEFRWRLRRLVRRAHARGVKVLLATVPANLRDWRPDRSLHDPPLGESQRRAWAEAFESGRRSLERSQFAAAAASLERAVEISPGHARSHYLLGRALEGLERWDEARRAYALACDHDASPQRRLSGINDAIRQVAAEERALLVDVDAIFEAASAHGLVGFELLEDYVHPTPEGHRLIAWHLWDAMARAGWLGPQAVAQRDLFEERVALRPAPTTVANDVWLFNQGVVLEHQGRPELAMEKYRQALAVNPRYPAAIWNLATLESGDGRYAEAAALLGRLLEVQPDHPNARLALAEALLLSGDDDEALGRAQEAVARAPESPEAHMRLATVLQERGQLDAARSAYERALVLRPDYARVHHNLGVLLKGQGDLRAAREHLERAAALSPERSDTRFHLGVLAEMRGDGAAARDWYRQALARRSSYVSAQNNLAWLLATSADASLRDPEEALRWARRAAERTGHENVGVLDTLAAASAAAGRFDEAVKWQTRAMELGDAGGRARHEERLVLYRAGRPYRQGSAR